MYIPFKDIKILFTSQMIFKFPFKMFIMFNQNLMFILLRDISHSRKQPLSQAGTIWEMFPGLHAIY